MAKTLAEYYAGQNQPLPSIEERGKLYEGYGLGTATDYIAKNRAGDIAPNTALLARLQSAPATTGGAVGTGVASTPFQVPPTNATPVVTDLNKTPLTLPAKLPEVPDAFVGSLNEIFKRTEAEDLALKERSTKVNEALDAGKALENEPTRLAEEEKRLGVEADTARLKDLNLLIAQRIGEFEAAKRQVQKQGISADAMSGRIGEIDRDKALEIGILMTQREAIKGNIEFAQDLAKRTIDLEFAPQRQKIENAKLFLSLNADIFDSADKKRVEAISAMLNERERIVSQEKEKKQQNYELAIAVAQAGGDFNSIDFTKTAEENLAAAAPFLNERAVFQNGKFIGWKKGTFPGESDSDGITFTNSQVQKGAVTAGIPLSDFGRLSSDDKAFFIQNSSDIQDLKDQIAEKIADGEDATEIERVISEDKTLPDSVKDTLVRHLKAQPAPEKTGWWGSVVNFFTGGDD